jgi:putative endonuclease
MAKHLELGKETEDRACAWFTSQFPAKLIARNYRCKTGELDLVFEQVIERAGVPKHPQKYVQSVELVIIEVRARAFGGQVSGIESVRPKKLQRLQKTIRHFLMTYKGPAQSVRLDLIAWDGERFSHLKNLWI